MAEDDDEDDDEVEDDDDDADVDDLDSKVEGGSDEGSGLSGIVAVLRVLRNFFVAVLKYRSQSSSPTPGMLRAVKSSCKACRIGGESTVTLP